MLAAGSFIHPSLAAAGAGAALLPIVIHFINRRRFRRMPWAAMGFLLAANRRSVKRLRFENALLLALRCTVMALLGLAVARPVLSGSGLSPLAQSRTHHVLILDNSASTQAVDTVVPQASRSATASSSVGVAGVPVTSGIGLSAGTRFERALAVADTLVSTFPASDPVSLVTAASPADAPIAFANYDRRQVRDRLRQVTVTDRGSDLAGAFRAAKKVLDTSSAAPGSRRVYLISDLQQTAWTSAESAGRGAAVGAAAPRIDPIDAGLAGLCRQIGSNAKLVLVKIGTEDADNVAITSLSSAASLAGGELPITLAAEVANLGRSAARGLSLQVVRDEIIARTVALDPLAPGTLRTANVTLSIDRAGTHALQVRLAGQQRDSLASDDARFLSVEISAAVPVLLVDGRRGPDPWSGQTGYLAAALAPVTKPGETQLFAPRVINDADLDTEVFSSYGVIVLCNVQRLEPPVWTRLEAFIADGGGLAIFAGDLLDRDHYNRYAYRGGAGLLPGELGEPVGDPSASRESFRIAPDSLVHPLLADFAGFAETGLFTARIDRFMPIKPDPAHAAVAARYDGSAAQPAIVTRAFGRGRVCYISTTAGMDWTNLPAKGDFVGLAMSLVAYLSPARGLHRNVLVGQPLVEPLTPAQSALPARVVTPTGEVIDGRVRKTAERFEFTFAATDQRGLYTLTLGHLRRTFAVNIDPRESDLAAVEEKQLREQIAAPFVYLSEGDITGGRAGADAPSELAAAAVAALLALIIVETWLATRFGVHR